MPGTRGGFTIPAPSKTSELTNDSQFMSVKEYNLSVAALSGSTTYTISDIPAGTVIHQVELLVDTAFTSSASQNNLAVKGADNTVIMDSSWNDPNTIGNYVTKCSFIVSSTIKLVHDLNTATAGHATLRLHLHPSV